ncbi:MAG: bifunctional DNA primase/polymerase [Chloroflexota bacterium]
MNIRLGNWGYSMNKVVDYAQIYASRGWHVLPLRGKIPIVAHGVKAASCDPDQILTWWTVEPNADVGIATGRQSGLVVLDVDPRHGGDESLMELEAKFGKLPPTPEVLTGGGGRHLYFKYPVGVQHVKCSAGQLGPGLDVRADGGYTVAPPSRHQSGKLYEWEASSDPMTDDPAEMPDWLLNLLTVSRPQTSSNGHKPNPNGAIPQGQRNTTLTSEAGKMRRAGLDEAAILAALRAINQAQCNPPLDDDEVKRIAASVCRYQPG